MSSCRYDPVIDHASLSLFDCESIRYPRQNNGRGDFFGYPCSSTAECTGNDTTTTENAAKNNNCRYDGKDSKMPKHRIEFHGGVGAFSVNYDENRLMNGRGGDDDYHIRHNGKSKSNSKYNQKCYMKQKESVLDGDTSMGSTSRRSAGVQSVQSLFHNEISLASQHKQDQATRRKCVYYSIATAFVILLAIVAAAGLIISKQKENQQQQMQTSLRNGNGSTNTPSTAPTTQAPIYVPPTERPVQQRGTYTIGDFLQSSPEFSVGLLITRPIMDLLSDPSKTYTLFMARDADFHDWEGSARVQKWRHPKWEPQFKDMLTNLVVAEEIREPQEQQVTSLSGHNLTLTPESVDGIQIVQLEKYWGSNGVIHLTNGFVFPPWITKTLQSELELQFPKFYALLDKSGILHSGDNAFLRGDDPMTVLIPSDEAIDRFPVDDSHLLTQILSYHILPDVNYVYKNRIGVSTIPSLLEGQDVSIDAYEAKVDGSVPLGSNYIIVNNGILQPLLGDEILIPEDVGLPEV